MSNQILLDVCEIHGTKVSIYEQENKSFFSNGKTYTAVIWNSDKKVSGLSLTSVMEALPNYINKNY
jgi:hypothetical protein